MSELHVVATIPVKSGSEEAARAALSTLITASRTEDGCLAYDLFESVSAPGTFVTVARWRSQQDHDAHMGTPHVAAAFAQADDLLGGDVQIHPLKPVF